MLSPAQRNQLRKRAALQAAVVAPAISMAGATAYEQQLLQLNQDRLRLKQVQSEQGKAELKRTLIPAYAPYIEGVLAAGNGAQDDVLTTLMVWYIDAGYFANALDIGAYVLKHNLKMPDRFARTTGCLLAEEVANGALKVQKAGGYFPLYVLEQAQTITAAHDMPDEARAKLHLATGKAMLGMVDEQQLDGELLEQAKAQLAKAIDLHGSCGGKKDLERVDRLLKKHAESKPTEPGTGEPPAN
ncbi:phage terminase small subunit [Stutzerimonas stutzeri]|uniref:Terminase endonuclease subunit n=1 Tax=Stutzerimonas stutzeri TaxID=316 RepID=A0A0D9AP88_STUST|nr:phage terminase small subunit [Stutzerimonas stutzeri]KJH82840.1 terminase endonuclease subunit [Stutzerimonas stutzeri]